MALPVAAAILFTFLTACDRDAAYPPSAISYQQRQTTFKTHLIRQGPSPQSAVAETPPDGVQEVVYPSGDLKLKAWIAAPPGTTPQSKVPAVVYFHGGFAFGASDFEDARPFLEAGFAVMCPMLRGENGNPGYHELYCGEVDDAKAAITWLAQQPVIDASRIYTFGHSAGGVISALLSLSDAPIRHGGSSGGLYGPDVFDSMKKQVPFSLDDPQERQMRVLVGNVTWMKKKHYAYAGTGDRWQRVDAVKKEAPSSTHLEVIALPGNHFTSLAPAIQEYVKILQSDKSPASRKDAEN